MKRQIGLSSKGCFLAGIVFLAMQNGACEESVDPIVGSAYPFTIWGFMNAGADTQRVRVYAISDELVLDNPSEAIDARVYSTDLTTGERREWTYKTVHFDSLNTGHLFWSPFRAEHEHRYRLEVVRSDGATSQVDVTVPIKVELRVGVNENRTLIPVQIIGVVPNLVDLKVIYHAVNVPPSNAWPPGTPIHPPVEHSVPIAYGDEVHQTGEGSAFSIDMVVDTAAVWGEYYDNCLTTFKSHSAPNIWLLSMEVAFVAADSTWAPPGRVFDPNLLSVPGTFSNVENGYGFYGAGESVQYLFIPSPDILRQAGYSRTPRCMTLSNSSECKGPPVPCLADNEDEPW